MSSHEQSTMSSVGLLRRLKALADARLGLPIRSHRSAPIGTAIVAVKRTFRLAAQPLINEVLQKQAAFNQEITHWAHALTHDIESVERSMVGMRTGLEIRLSRLEAAVARLEKAQQASSGVGAQVSTPDGPRTN